AFRAAYIIRASAIDGRANVGVIALAVPSLDHRKAHDAAASFFVMGFRKPPRPRRVARLGIHRSLITSRDRESFAVCVVGSRHDTGSAIAGVGTVASTSSRQMKSCPHDGHML